MLSWFINLSICNETLDVLIIQQLLILPHKNTSLDNSSESRNPHFKNILFATFNRYFLHDNWILQNFDLKNQNQSSHLTFSILKEQVPGTK